MDAVEQLIGLGLNRQDALECLKVRFSYLKHASPLFDQL
jgi:hypothetical protein